MGNLSPTLIGSLKKYNAEKFFKDLKAGFLVSVIALPLSIALAIASGVRPENGLYSAIVGGLFVSLFSGSRVQIGGITAATVMTVCTIIDRYGIVGLCTASIMAGIFLIIMGFCKLGSMLKYIPITITTGFTAGIAAGIFTSQIKEFLGLSVTGMPIRILDKWVACGKAISTFQPLSILVGLISVILLVVIPKITSKVPPQLAMLFLMTSVVYLFRIPVATVGSAYGSLSPSLPQIAFPAFSMDMIEELLAPSLTLALLIAIVSLLSCVVTDGLIGKRHNSNMELIAQGIANIFCGLFQAVPVAGAVARSTVSVKNGGKSQVAGIVHSFFVLLMLLFLTPLISYLPMPSLAAMLMVVAWRMVNWQEIVYTVKHAPKSDAFVLFITIAVAVIIDLMAAIEIGLLMTAFLFMKRMAEVSHVNRWIDEKGAEEVNDEENDDENDSDNMELKTVPEGTIVYEIWGPMFFAASDKLSAIRPEAKDKCLILRMRSVTAMDATAMHRFEQLYEKCRRYRITMILSHVNEQPMSVMVKACFHDKIGSENICHHIDDALARASEICRRK